MSRHFEIVVPMSVNVDGAPNAYGPDDRAALDYERNARVRANPGGRIVGYLTRGNDGRTPIVQSPGDPCPGFYISTTAYFDRRNPRREDPRRYVNAADINYVVRATAAQQRGAVLGDFCAVHSLRSRLTVPAIVGDSGNSSGAEGSLALLQRLGYPVVNGKSGTVREREIVVRYFPGSNPERRFFHAQWQLDRAFLDLALDADFSSHHPGDPGALVLAAAPVSPVEVPSPRTRPFAPLQGPAPRYPGRLIRRGSPDFASVKKVQQRLKALGYTETTPRGPRPLTVDGDFGDQTESAVKLFQTRHTDADGDPLRVDGEVGANTWAALFGASSVSPRTPPADDPLLAAALAMARQEIGVLERPPGSNRGPRVQQYQASAGVASGQPWCAAFVYFCFAEAARKLGRSNPVIRTGGVLDHWNRARTRGISTITTAQGLDQPSRIKPGSIFIISTGNGTGHTGLVERVEAGKLITLEGNTNEAGSREGIGVFRRRGRSVASINRGWIDYSGS